MRKKSSLYFVAVSIIKGNCILSKDLGPRVYTSNFGFHCLSQFFKFSIV